MDRLVLRLVINALALYLAVGTGWIEGIEGQSTQWWAYLVMALVFTLVNALLKPILKLLTCPFILLTLGLFTLVINTLLFWLTGLLGGLFGSGFGFRIETFWAGLLGALLVGIVNTLLTLIFRDELK
ncbi:MAG: phage holin family protein [Anaerolineales bacterium]|nr:MAG: phage holin family protein [Anaerolineales bacterium]